MATETVDVKVFEDIIQGYFIFDHKKFFLVQGEFVQQIDEFRTSYEENVRKFTTARRNGIWLVCDEGDFAEVLAIHLFLYLGFRVTEV
jgi:hypothetical protein